jgi:hypothetical protein
VDHLIVLIIAGGAAVATGAWFAWRRSLDSWERLATGVGLRVSGRGGLEGTYAGRGVHLTRLPGLEGLLSVDLWPDWSPNFFAAAEGMSRPLARLQARYPALHEALTAVMRTHRAAEIRHGRMVLRLRDWPEGDTALRAAFDVALQTAQRLDAAMAEVTSAEVARIEAWKAGLARAGLVYRGPDQIGGSCRGCDVELRKTERGARVTAGLGPDLPQGWTVHTREEGRADSADLPGLPSGIVVRTRQRERMLRLWAHPGIRKALGHLFEVYPRTEIRDGTLTVEVPAWDEPTDALVAALDPVCDLIIALQLHTDWPAKRRAKT